MGDGVYYSDSAKPERPGARRAKKAAVAVVGLAALAGGAYFAVSLLTGVAHTSTLRHPQAYAPVAPSSAEPSSDASAGSPSPGPMVGTKSAVRQSQLPSPSTPATPLSDEALAAAQVSRLLQAPPRPAASGLVAAASGPVTVDTETGTDGSQIRVVSAHYDLTEHTGLLAAADPGQPVNGARCTRNLELNEHPQVRPALMLCWRTAANRSVVTVALGKIRTPTATASAAVLNRRWFAMG